MIHQLDFTLNTRLVSDLDSELAVKLQGALLNQIPGNLAEELHRQELRPYSLYVYPQDEKSFRGQLTVLEDRAFALLEAVMKMDSFTICGNPQPAILSERHYSGSINFCESLPAFQRTKLRINFVTPAMYKLHSVPCSFPDLPRLFHSVIVKLNKFEGIELSEEQFREALAEVRVAEWKLNNVQYRVTGRVQPGMIGYAELILPQDKLMRETLTKVLFYAEFCGVGARTAMGMGGFSVQDI